MMKNELYITNHFDILNIWPAAGLEFSMSSDKLQHGATEGVDTSQPAQQAVTWQPLLTGLSELLKKLIFKKYSPPSLLCSPHKARGLYKAARRKQRKLFLVWGNYNNAGADIPTG